jgi:hypothetical protein
MPTRATKPRPARIAMRFVLSPGLSEEVVRTSYQLAGRNPARTASPPVRGVGRVWMDKALGRSMAPSRARRRLAMGMRTKETAKDRSAMGA